jgi:hypothetical protein
MTPTEDLYRLVQSQSEQMGMGYGREHEDT